MLQLSYRLRLTTIAASLIAAIGLISRGSQAQVLANGLQISDPNATPPTAVVTYHNDNGRTGLFSKETLLTPANVNWNNFGLLFTQAVDGYVYAQPLFVPGVQITGKGTHDVVYVCTEHDSVYAFDADSNAGNNAAALWKTSFITGSGVTTVPSADTDTTDIVPEIGISATPVIDCLTQTIFVEAKTKETNAGGIVTYVHRLHALDLRTGLEKIDSPVVVTATSRGTGDGNDGNGNVPWNPLRQHVRPALLMNEGIVYLAAASHGDNGPYHGWVLGYDPLTLRQLSVINLTPNGGLGGIWESGCGLAADSVGNMYGATGNGTFDADPSLGGGIDYGDSVIKLSVTGGKLQVADFFTPQNQQNLDDIDGDLGSGGYILPPTQPGKYPNIIIGCGKQGRIYVVNRDNMGHFHANTDACIQTLDAIVGTWSSPAYFNNNIYFNGQGDILKCFSLSNSMLSTSPTSQSNVYVGYPGATPSISANGTKNGIVWLIDNSAYGATGPAILHAFNAANVNHELYNSNQAPGGRDVPGNAVKFTVPTISSGKVFVGTEATVAVYGQLGG